ncbi:hypothetical protein C8F04DRAFT_1198929 [Mycena alexandri]|uniref:Uncharacterized protein n=1 Tax=Mycena alexandri TaxID=1745969 RepID=A0AAD6S0C8_9AGAR|nr:hypothetical protein C8F04DRAFT_1198929 [Mycena alexandri]
MQACTWFPKLFAANLAKSECRPQAAHYPPSSHPVNACYAPLRLMGTLSSTPSLPGTVLLLQEALTWSPQVSITILKIDIITFHEDPSPQVLKIFVCAIQGLNLLYYVALTQVPNNEILNARSVKFVPSCLCRPTATELLPSVAPNATSCYQAVAGCYQVLPTGGLVYRGFPATGATECYLVKPVFPDDVDLRRCTQTYTDDGKLNVGSVTDKDSVRTRLPTDKDIAHEAQCGSVGDVGVTLGPPLCDAHRRGGRAAAV